MTETTEEVLRRQADAAAFEREQRTSASQSTVLDTAFDADTEAGTPPIKLLPAGKYTAAITSATVGPTKNGRGTMVNLTWSISEGDFAKRLLFQNILIEHDNEDARRIGRRIQGRLFELRRKRAGQQSRRASVQGLFDLGRHPHRQERGIPGQERGQEHPAGPAMDDAVHGAVARGGVATPQAFVASKELPDDVIPF